MPGTSYGLPARACITGAKLAKVPLTACSVCYALSDRYASRNAAEAQRRRLASLSHPRWVEAMTLLLLHVHRVPRFKVDAGVKNAKRRGLQRWQWNEAGFHRWHDSGDLQSTEHFGMICEVARRTPRIRHWLPTQELGMVKCYLAGGGAVPANLAVRVSSVMIDDAARRAWPLTSSVVAARTPDNAHICPAPTQDHRCGACRACWSREVPHVAYELH